MGCAKCIPPKIEKESEIRISSIQKYPKNRPKSHLRTIYRYGGIVEDRARFLEFIRGVHLKEINTLSISIVDCTNKNIDQSLSDSLQSFRSLPILCTDPLSYTKETLRTLHKRFLPTRYYTIELIAMKQVKTVDRPSPVDEGESAYTPRSRTISSNLHRYTLYKEIRGKELIGRLDGTYHLESKLNKYELADIANLSRLICEYK